MVAPNMRYCYVIILIRPGVESGDYFYCCDFGMSLFKGTDHDVRFQISLFSTLADIFAV